MNAAYGYPDHEHAERVSLAMDAIVSDPCEYREFSRCLIAKHWDDLSELLTGAYDFGPVATKRFQTILKQCEQALRDRAERNLNEGMD